MSKAMKDASLIPLGGFCYIIERTSTGTEQKHVCPWWSIDNKLPKQSNGVCSFLGLNDLELRALGSSGMLWDECKECDENWGDDPWGTKHHKQ